MKIKIYIKESLRKKSPVLTLFISCALALGLCISFNSQKTSKQAEKPLAVKLPVLMYHMVLEHPKKGNKFTVSSKIFEDDLKYITKHGYTTILVKDLIEYTENKKELPQKPIMLTFDDGAYNNYLYAFPLAKKYNAKFVFSPIGKESDRYSEIADETPGYAHANWKRISEMASSGLVEIQNHTYNMHCAKKPRIGCTQKCGESQKEYEKKLVKDLEKSQKAIKEKTNFEPTAFFYPFGACSKCSEAIIKLMGFKATFMCESKINLITKNPDCLFGLNRFLRPPEMSSETFFKKIEK